jgi:LPS-assembly protein
MPGSRLWAQTSVDGLLIQAESGEHDLKKHSLELTGNVQIIFKNQHLTADKAIIYRDRKEFEAEGHVVFVTPKASLGGNKIVMNYETNVGTVYSGFIQSGQVIFEGAVIEKTGEDQYYTIQSQYTTCTTCPAAWSFSGQTIEAQIGGYALIKNSVMRIATVPVLWLPYLIVPLKSERQTGLLTPSFEHSTRGGVSISQPFFWAISPNKDATITMQTYANRGLKALTNFRYLLNNGSSGELDAGFIRDSYFGQTIDSSTDSRYTKFLGETSRVNRWFTRYRHYWLLPNDWIQRMDINNASDLQYPNDFPFETHDLGEPAGAPALETRVSLTKNSYDRHFSIDNSYYINMLKGHPKADNRDSIQRLPEISLISTRTPIGETGFLYNYDLRYTNFARNDFAFDDLTAVNVGQDNQFRHITYKCADGSMGNDPRWEDRPDCQPFRDGQFDPQTDLIRSGQRFIFEPSIVRPIQLGNYFNLVPRLSVRESHYSFGIQDVSDLTRRSIRTEVKLQTSYSRIFGDLSNPSSDRFKHELQPEIISTSVPWLDQPNHPFLGFTQSAEIPFYSREAASDSDLFGDNGVQFDYEDRLYDRNLITYRMTNKITRKVWSGDKVASYDRLLTWRLSQTYDVHEARRAGDNRQPWSDIESILSIRLPHFNTYTKINLFPYQKLSNTSSTMTVNDDNGNYLQLGLVRKYTPDNKGTIDVSKRIEDYTLQIGTTAKYVNFAGRLLYNGNDEQAAIDKRRIKSVAYAVILKPPGNCWAIHFWQHRDFASGDSTENISFDFLFDGKTSNIISSKFLNAYGF